MSHQEYTLIREATPVARKGHRCIWCGDPIAIGEKYRHEISRYEGQMQNHHWHFDCNEAAGEFFRLEGPDFTPYAFKRGTQEQP